MKLNSPSVTSSTNPFKSSVITFKAGANAPTNCCTPPLTTLTNSLKLSLNSSTRLMASFSSTNPNASACKKNSLNASDPSSSNATNAAPSLSNALNANASLVVSCLVFCKPSANSNSTSSADLKLPELSLSWIPILRNAGRSSPVFFCASPNLRTNLCKAKSVVSVSTPACCAANLNFCIKSVLNPNF